MAILGIDTSCYRTSIALVQEGRTLREKRRLLMVPNGSRGLRQSEAVFQHINNLPALFEEIMEGLPCGIMIEAAAVSSRPRDREDSYMPVFLAGESVARSIAAVNGIPLFRTSHQQGHLRAALADNGPIREKVLAMHLSGGTTEILLADEKLGIELLGGTGDLHAGQLVDRVGVALGAGFPAGESLEELAAGHKPQQLFPTSVRGLEMSLSGAENSAMKMIKDGADPGQVAAEVYSVISRSAAKMIARAHEMTKARKAILFGGVASSETIRRMTAERLKRLCSPVELMWADKNLSGDNAVGVALIGWDRYTEESL